ncbi:hypothetical protein [Synechococcus sp. RedBA-s]|uniref:hypothetical protein n=1 Tax=Synechococcus sp. RedBA-s TaxID=2823741 RepID=UPI0020CDDF66|nr:hypothetical protein [Synechococcus sp. RedBA-s]MCP9800719.1 hypothetical protein [Synechococcus sp. RedBA-s]
MNDHQLGVTLRQQVLSNLQQGRGTEGRRLQALAGDLCGEEQLKLLPALRHLLLSAAFASAVSQSPPLDGSRLQPRLMQELEEVFNPSICQRMESVVEGLLGQSLAKARDSVSEPAPAPASQGGGNNALLSGLAFLSGGLAVALVGAVLLLRQSPPSSVEIPSTPRPRAVAPAPSAKPLAPPQQVNLPEPEPITPPQPPAANIDQAIAAVEGLYAALSGKSYDQARSFFGGTAADQFDPAFFNQFERVSVADLRETGQEGFLVTLQGVVTFAYPDGSVQSESRRFSVDTASTPALITASEFGGVIKAR